MNLQKIATAEAELETLRSELALKSEQLGNVTYRLDSLVALNEKNAKENPDAARIKELEDRLALHTDAAVTHKAQMDIHKDSFESQISKLTVDNGVKDREIEALKEQVKVANERAFTAETRLGREQALSRDLSAQLNQLRLQSSTPPPSASATPAGSHLPVSASASPSVSRVVLTPRRTELDDLSLDDLDAFTPVSTVTKASVAVAQGKPAPATKDWSEIDTLLGDIQGGRK